MSHRHATDAPTPWKMTRANWIQVAKRAWKQINANNVSLIAAGVAFYCFTGWRERSSPSVF